MSEALKMVAMANMLPRGPIPPVLHSDSSAQNEDIQRTPSALRDHAQALTNLPERVGHLVQIAVPLPHRLPHPLHGPAMDLLRAQNALQHRVQDCLHQQLRLHRLPHAE
jgi:hypothetical protein